MKSSLNFTESENHPVLPHTYAYPDPDPLRGWCSNRGYDFITTAKKTKNNEGYSALAGTRIRSEMISNRGRDS